MLLDRSTIEEFDIMNLSTVNLQDPKSYDPLIRT